MDRSELPLIGIVGGIASGKTFVAEQLERHGAAVVSADRLAHDVLRLPEIKQAVRKRWGDAVFGTGGEVDRAALAKIVFAAAPEGPRELKLLEQLTHPKIGQLAREEIENLRHADTAVAIVLDVPLMLESGWDKFCDKIVYVDAPVELRRARAVARGWSEEEFTRREAAQQALETKSGLADMIIDNSGSPESVQAQIERLWPALLGRAPTS